VLEDLRVKIYILKSIIIQKYWKMYSTRRYYKLLKASTIKIQACTTFSSFYYYFLSLTRCVGFRGYRARKCNPLAWKRKQIIKIQTRTYLLLLLFYYFTLLFALLITFLKLSAVRCVVDDMLQLFLSLERRQRKICAKR
jgi:hypothetical protein